ncbi:putative proline racemase [Aspergillus undulatus]|uniref:putative proline racemase n=1 Tax=Aspergillus undulatus TaxID=1810928 RepID=UPI003CCE409A
MDIATSFLDHPSTIKCIDMHTTGEPTRIVYSGFPHLDGPTLLDKRDQSQTHHDNLRKRLMLEPRGHNDMYGAILIPDTELVRSGEAHIGVLFTHAGGFSTMCGHATIALGRFLVDTRDLKVFPKRNELVVDAKKKEVEVKIHAPCGVVTATVPIHYGDDGTVKSDGSRGVSFLSTPGYVAALNIEVEIPDEIRWAQLEDKPSVTVDISYGGAFYALIEARDMGFRKGLRSDESEMKALASAARDLKNHLSTHPAVKKALRLAEDDRLSFLYSVMIVDSKLGYQPDNSEGAETGLCFFGDGDQIDRSPTGSCVTARMALAHTRRRRGLGERWAYNSIVSNRFRNGAFVGTIVDEDVNVIGFNGGNWPAVIVRVEGSAFYTGAVTFVHEADDVTSESGFAMAI